MSSLSPESRAIIDAALPGEDLPGEARDRLKRKLMIATGVAAAGAATATATQAAAAAQATKAGAAATAAAIPMVSSVGVLTKIGATVLLVGGLGVGAQQLMTEDEPAPAATTSVATVKTPLQRPSEAAPKQPKPVDGNTEPAPVASTEERAPRAAQNKRPAKPTASSIAAETELLQQAQSELASGDPQKALELLDQHGSKHATGALREERQAARVLALCRAGRADDARAEARRFAAEFPRSPHRARVMSACADE